MAGTTPVLERKLNTEEEVTTEESRSTFMTAEERHNARIRLNYARLINPDTKIGDIIEKENVPQQHVEEPVVEEPQIEQKPYLVENARADAEIFRADSAINRVQTEVNEIEEEEENEDLRPSAETFKYKAGVATKVVVEDKISNREEKVSRFSKRDKVVMAVAFLVIVALFILVIVNSAVLTKLNNEISYLETDLVAAQEDYAEVLESKEIFFDNIEETVTEFALQHGMTNIGDK